jgi:hypothetical protein
MPGKRTIPCRGMKQDWYGANEQKILDNYKKYAKKSINNNLLGSPDFEEFRSFLVKYEENKRPKHRHGQLTSKHSLKK